MNKKSKPLDTTRGSWSQLKPHLRWAETTKSTFLGLLCDEYHVYLYSQKFQLKQLYLGASLATSGLFSSHSHIRILASSLHPPFSTKCDRVFISVPVTGVWIAVGTPGGGTPSRVTNREGKKPSCFITRKHFAIVSLHGNICKHNIWLPKYKKTAKSEKIATVSLNHHKRCKSQFQTFAKKMRWGQNECLWKNWKWTRFMNQHNRQQHSKKGVNRSKGP